VATHNPTPKPAKNAGLRNNFNMKLLTELYKIPAKTVNEEQIGKDDTLLCPADFIPESHSLHCMIS
jgi:hypothetical protein